MSKGCDKSIRAMMLCLCLGLLGCSDGDKTASVQAGMEAYEQGNFSQAREQFRSASEDDQPIALYNLGVMYWNGDGVPSDRKEAQRLFSEAGERDVPQAFTALGLLAEEADSLDPGADPAELYRRAIEAGDLEALSRLADLYDSGLRIKRNHFIATWLYKAAADAGSIRGVFKLADRLAVGAGGRIDEPEALDLYLRAAEAGYPEAQQGYASLLEYGLGGATKDEAEAFGWHLKAANQGNAEAQVSVATAYRFGQGVQKSLEEAYFWYRLALRDPDLGYVTQFLDLIQPEMTADQIASASARAKEWDGPASGWYGQLLRPLLPSAVESLKTSATVGRATIDKMFGVQFSTAGDTWLSCRSPDAPDAKPLKVSGASLANLFEYWEVCWPQASLRRPHIGPLLSHDGPIESSFAGILRSLQENLLAIYGREEFVDGLGPTLKINSSGGDVAAAMAAGDAMGFHRWTLQVWPKDKCFSACVFLAAAASERLLAGEVGIHRIRLAGSAALNPTDMATELADVLKASKEFVSRHGVSPQIVDDMMLVPSDQIRVLRRRELEQYGLGLMNAVQADIDRNALIAKCGEDFANRLNAARDRSILCLDDPNGWDGWEACRKRMFNIEVAGSPCNGIDEFALPGR